MTSDQNEDQPEDQPETTLSMSAQRHLIEQQIRFGRAECDVCGGKLDDTSAIVKGRGENGMPVLIPLCGYHARAHAYDGDEYSDELRGAVAALKKCTSEERHWLIQILEKVHSDETRDGILNCNLCERKNKGSGETRTINLGDIPGTVIDVLKKLDRISDKLDDTKKEPWVNEKVALWNNVDDGSDLTE